MSKLDDLIKELCPDGVEYKLFFDVCDYIRGITYNKNDEVNDGSDGIKVFRANNITLETNTLNYEDVKVVSSDVKVKQNQWLKKGDILICAGSGSKEHIGKVAYIFKDIDYTFGGFMGVIRPKDNSVNAGFMFHILTSDMFKKHLAKVSGSQSSTINNINNDTWKGFTIPVPPLPVQEEIVRILDTFTSLTAELTAELTARRKQYEHYRDSLLSRETKVDYKSIEECTEKTENIKWKETKGDYQYIDLSSVDRETSKIVETSTINATNAPSRAQQIVHTDDVLFGTTRPLLKRCCSVPKEFDGQIASTGFCILRPNKKIVNPRWLYFIVSSSDFYRYIEPLQVQGSYPSVTNSNVKGYKFPLPPLEIQQRIVNILDNFDSICTDLKIGLPAEIEARKKQYEYYRDLLLTFASSGNTIFAEQNRTDEIKLLQYVFGYAVVQLGEIAAYADTRIKAKDIVPTDYVSVENLLQNKQGVAFTDKMPTGDSFICYQKNDILIGNIRPYLKKIWKSDRTGGTNGDVLTVRIKNEMRKNISAAYLYYQLSSDNFFNYDMQNAKGAKMPRGSKDAVMKYEIPLPPLEEQERIVKILDRFDSLCNDISSGLPAEIEARQKQYEYYRDKLLQFTIKNA